MSTTFLQYPSKSLPSDRIRVEEFAFLSAKLPRKFKVFGISSTIDDILIAIRISFLIKDLGLPPGKSERIEEVPIGITTIRSHSLK